MKLITTYATIILLAMVTVSETQARRYECPTSSMPKPDQGRRVCVIGTNIIGSMCIPCEMLSVNGPEGLNNFCILEFPEKCPPRCPEDLLEKCTKACPLAKDKTQCEKKCADDFKKCRESKCKAITGSTETEGGC